jgi:type I restriction enzyme M protein
VGLPSNLFHGAGIPAALIIVNRNKDKVRTGKVIFVDASREFQEGSARSYLREADVQTIVATVHAYEDVEQYARVVEIAEIENNDWNLSVARYVQTADVEGQLDLASAVGRLREVESARDQAKAVMDNFLRELGYDA